MRLSMCPVRKAFAQLRAKKVPSLLVATAFLVTLVVTALWARGEFSVEKFTYVPDREYRLADVEKAEPATLEELLHSAAPNIDTVFRNPSIAAELSNAKTLTDVVDSRTALNNLRGLDRQMSEWLQELPRLSVEEPKEEAAVANLGPDSLRNVDWEMQTTSLGAAAHLREQAEVVRSLQTSTRRLLAVPSYSELITIPPSVNMKGVWQSPDEALIHMVPSGDWVPEQGYKLYRVVNGQKELLKEQLLSPSKIAENLTIENTDVIKDLLLCAELTPDKLASLEMTAEGFRNLAYSTDTRVARPRVSGKHDFLKMKETLITIPADIDQKMPETDRMLCLPICVLSRQGNDKLTLAASKTALWKSLSLIAVEPLRGVNSLKLAPGGASKLLLAQSVLEARQQLSTLSFVDDEFAEEAGFLFRDDISRLNLPNDTAISYVVETPDGSKSTLVVMRGTENRLSKPQGPMGYGIDGKVPLRWEEPENPNERGILSGYFIERRLDGEKEFTQINEKPIVVTYTLDETGVYFESPVFHEDTVENGRTAEYRIRSIDIFGRTSEYSDVSSFRVEKVTPPNAPSVERPVLSDDAQGASSAVLEAISLNGRKRGVVLPIYTDSPDTVRFTIYRAVAVGAEGFGKPESIADLIYKNPAAEATAGLDPELIGSPTISELKQAVPATVVKKRLNKALHVQLANLSSQHPDLIYFDSDIQEGHTYKYWVSARDSWNNESAWSPSVSAAVRTDREPGITDSLSISMCARELPDYSQEPPGITYDDVVSLKDLSATHSLPRRKLKADSVTDILLEAEAQRVSIGEFISGTSRLVSPGTSIMPSVIDRLFNNLPEERYVHMFVAVRGEDVLPDGTARLKWPAYSGDGLGGYAVYRPLFDTLPIEQMQRMSRDELVQMGRWYRTNDKTTTNNQYVVGGLSRIPGSVSLFLICLEPETSSTNGGAITPGHLGFLPTDFTSALQSLPEGGYVYINWQAPSDPQVAYYRVYRSEVPSFEKPIDESKLEWTLLGDHITAPTYTERVDQSFAHYYYYKVTSVSPWGVESKVGAIHKFRVPSTKPPQTPNLLLPLSRKDGVQVNFSAVSHCDRYEIYRTQIPVIDETQLNNLLKELPDLFVALFDSPSKKDFFISGMLRQSLKPHSSALNPLPKFKTLSQAKAGNITTNLVSLSDKGKMTAYQRVLDKFGPLALADYIDLSEEMLRRILWVKVGELPADFDTAEAVDPATGLLKPLSFMDATAEYGVMYLYTVQAWNDDNLGSSRPEPVQATPRRNRPFEPIGGLHGEFKDGKPYLTWNAPTMQNLTLEQCRRDTVGYIVYRSDKEDGTYCQASPMLFDTEWKDEGADPSAFNWYRVKVLDTGGYLSEFSEPVLIRRNFVSTLTTIIPRISADPLVPGGQPATVAPKITVSSTSFRVIEGTAFRTSYALTGTDPIGVTVGAKNADGTAIPGFSADTGSRTISAPGNLRPGVYSVAVKAKNAAGESSAVFSLEVQAKTAPVVPPQIAVDGTKFTVDQGTVFETVYQLTGTEPITVLVTATAPTGGPVTGFSVDTDAHLIRGPKDLSPGRYEVAVTAKNTAGVGSVSFTLEVRPVRTPPKLLDRRDGYRFSMTSGTNFSTQLEASGSTPLTWSVEPINARLPVPSVVGIGGDGLLTVNGDIAAGTYGFVIRVQNDVGSDTREAQLEVASVLKPPIRPPIKPPIKPLVQPKNISWDGRGAGVTLLGAPSTITQSVSETYLKDKIMCMTFTLTDVRLFRPMVAGAAYSGTAMLNTGYAESIPVKILGADITNKGSLPEMTAGSVYVEKPHELAGIGVTLVSLEISPTSKKSVVSGYVNSTLAGQNLIGDLGTLEFTNAELTNSHIILRRGLPNIRYEQFIFHDVREVWIRLNGNQPGFKDFISVVSGITMKSI